ncbi:non-ribosomal peptide synthetase, partial [Agrobacterium tumefaciens]|uniref:non-ribosomal peptide synthetase n=1 Tax=Agrobacterium tumefaciens TaxID=358 RepID=UPI002243A66B
NQDLPFDRLVAELQPDRNSHESPLTRVKFLLRDERPTESSIAELRCNALPLSDSEAHFDISLDVTETPTTIECRFSYDIEKFASSVMEAFCENYQLLVQQLASERSTRIGGLDFKVPAEAVHPSATAEPLILARIARNCRELGSNTAIVEDDRSITWEALWKQSGDLASRLVDAGISTEVPVAVQLPRSIELVVTLLAIWRTGGIYVPLDSSAPAERIVKQLGSAGIEVVISNEPLPGQTTSLAWITPEERGSGTIDDFETLPDQAAYIIFTSGSTGAPKGVTISHRALADYISALASVLPSEIRSAAYTSTPAADLGHTVLFGALHYGWVLHLVPDRLIVDPDGFSEFMQANEIELLKIVPSHLTGLLEATAPVGVLPSRCIVLGGEAASKRLADRIAHLRPTCRLINHYGPTETTVGVLTRAGGDTAEPILPIGRALAHVHVDVRDRDGNVVPYGADGEVCVSGSALARGYARMPSATAERFVPAPFGPPGSRMYRTGDRGHQLHNGEIAFRGRFDDQVKIRGYRVEPGEIAHHLRNLPNVIDAIVVARIAEEGNAELHGYAVGKALDGGDLRHALSVVLPPQMIPSTIQVIDRIPVTLNGKVDRKKLPVPGDPPDTQNAVPTSEAEKVLLDIWQEVLGRGDFGVLSDFFDLGGDSIRGLKIVARAKKAGLPVTPNSLFEKRTVRALAEGFSGDGASRRKLEEMSALLDDLK